MHVNRGTTDVWFKSYKHHQKVIETKYIETRNLEIYAMAPNSEDNFLFHS